MRVNTLFAIRYPKTVNFSNILQRVHLSGTPFGLKQVDSGVPIMEINVWTTEPNALKGIIQDHNDYWPGLKIGIVSETKQKD